MIMHPVSLTYLHLQTRGASAGLSQCVVKIVIALHVCELCVHGGMADNVWDDEKQWMRHALFVGVEVLSSSTACHGVRLLQQKSQNVGLSAMIMLPRGGTVHFLHFIYTGHRSAALTHLVNFLSASGCWAC